MIKLKDLFALETGDILLFRDSSWLSWGLQFVGKSRYSHVGIVLKNPRFLNPRLEDGFYILESTVSTVPNAETGKLTFGVQIHHLDDIIKDRSSGWNKPEIYYRHVECKRDENFYKTFKLIHDAIHGKPYDLNIVDWYDAWKELGIDQPLHDVDPSYRKTTQFWCSALAAFVYSKLGLIQSDIPWSIISPREFSDSEGHQLAWKCLLGSDELLVKL